MYYGHYVNGIWGEDEETIVIKDKYTEKEFAKIGSASKKRVSEAVENAQFTFNTVGLSPVERYNILMRASELIKKRKKELVNVIVSEAGKVYNEASTEVDRTIQTFIASAEEAKRISGTEIPMSQPNSENKLAFTVRDPVGVIGAITPFNYPLNLTAHKIGPAIASGNTVVLKPASLTPISACKLVDIMTDSGLPAGFLNLVNGSGKETGEFLLEDTRIDMYTFTGSPEIGKHIKNKTGIKKVALELGNNSPNIIHKDATNLQQIVQSCVNKGFSNAGQSCIAVQKIYVHEEIYDEVVKRAKEITNKMVVGNPENEQTQVGPMITESEAKRAENWVLNAEQEGAKILSGGTRSKSVFTPTLLIDVKEEMKVACEEIFAPVISVISYNDIEKLFNTINGSNLALQAGLFTSNMQLALNAMQKLRFGGVIINDVSSFRADIMPYGGIKDSGLGKEGPHYAVQEMTNEKLIVINL